MGRLKNKGRVLNTVPMHRDIGIDERGKEKIKESMLDEEYCEPMDYEDEEE